MVKKITKENEKDDGELRNFIKKYGKPPYNHLIDRGINIPQLNLKQIYKRKKLFIDQERYLKYPFPNYNQFPKNNIEFSDSQNREYVIANEEIGRYDYIQKKRLGEIKSIKANLSKSELLDLSGEELLFYFRIPKGSYVNPPRPNDILNLEHNVYENLVIQIDINESHHRNFNPHTGSISGICTIYIRKQK